MPSTVNTPLAPVQQQSIGDSVTVPARKRQRTDPRGSVGQTPSSTSSASSGPRGSTGTTSSASIAAAARPAAKQRPATQAQISSVASGDQFTGPGIEPKVLNFQRISATCDAILESALAQSALNQTTFNAIHEVLCEIHQQFSGNEMAYRAIIGDPNLLRMATETHYFWGISLYDMFGEDIQASSNSNWVYQFAHGTTVGGAAGIVKLRQVLKSCFWPSAADLPAEDTFGFFAICCYDISPAQEAVKWMAEKLLRMGKGQQRLFVTGVAQNDVQHATRRAGSVQDDQRDAYIKGIVHNTSANRWCVREDLASTGVMWFGQQIPLLHLPKPQFRRPISGRR